MTKLIRRSHDNKSLRSHDNKNLLTNNSHGRSCAASSKLLANRWIYAILCSESNTLLRKQVAAKCFTAGQVSSKKETSPLLCSALQEHCEQAHENICKNMDSAPYVRTQLHT